MLILLSSVSLNCLSTCILHSSRVVRQRLCILDITCLQYASIQFVGVGEIWIGICRTASTNCCATARGVEQPPRHAYQKTLV
jgi:hypothetical protein